jgi:hypothetical protein
MVSKVEHARRTIAKIEARLTKSPNPKNQQELVVCLDRWREYLASFSPQEVDPGATRPAKP